MAISEKLRAVAIALAMTGALPACAVIDAEKNVSGGFMGKLADDYFMQVNTPEGEVYRATLITTALVMAAERRVVNHGNIRQALSQINGITDTLNAAYDMATSPCGYPENSGALKRRNGGLGTAAARCVPARAIDANDKDVPRYALGFQMQLYRLNPQLFNLAAVSLPDNEFKTLVHDTISGNYLAALWDLFGLAKEAVLTAAPMYAAYRGGRHALADGFEFADKGSQHQRADAINTGSYGEAVKFLADHATTMQQTQYPTKDAFFALFREIQQSCLNIASRLPRDEDISNECPTRFIGYKLPLKGLSGAGNLGGVGKPSRRGANPS